MLDMMVLFAFTFLCLDVIVVRHQHSFIGVNVDGTGVPYVIISKTTDETSDLRSSPESPQ